MSGPLPLLGLRAFVEVGRHGSMKAASQHLGVTPGAVSQQVKALEARLGLMLFERLNRELRLTPGGKCLLAEVSEAFGRIETALADIARDRAAGRTTLIISTTGAFAATWLVPRLGRFTALQRHVEVQIRTGQELVPIGAGPGHADLAIRHGLGAWPGLAAEALLRPRLVPVGHPGLLEGGPPIRKPEDCLQYPLLHDMQAEDWRLWLQALGVQQGRRVTRGMRFSDSTLLTRAAAAGQGLALLRDTYVADDIAAGRLRIAFDAPWPAEFAYYVVTRPGANRKSAMLESFRAWLLREAAAEA